MKITLEIEVDTERNRVHIEVKSPHGASAEICVPIETSPLTDRETEVLVRLANGQSVKEIARELDFSVKTAEAHRYNIMRKLNIHNRVHLAHYAIRKGLIQVEGVEVTPIDRSA